MRHRSIALLCACLLAGQSLAASAQGPTPPPWFEGRLETDAFALTIPDGWVAIDAHADLLAQAQALADRFDARSRRCGTARADAIYRWLRGEDESVRLLLQSLPSNWADGPPYNVDTCRLMGPESRQGHPLSEFAGIIWDVLDGSPGVEVNELPRPLEPGGDTLYTFDFTAPGAHKEGTVYLLGGAGDFAWITCEASAAPDDRWRSLVESFELITDADPSGVDASGRVGQAAGEDHLLKLQAMLPVWVAGRPLCSYSMRGLDYLREWSRIPDDQLRELEEDPTAFEALLPRGMELDDIEFANAGRADPDDPCAFVTAFRIRGIPARMLPLSMVVDDPDAGSWTDVRFGGRVVRTGTEAMLYQESRCGRPFTYDVGDVRFVVTTDDEGWAAEAIARLRPEAAVENGSLLVTLPRDWRPGLSPSLDEERRAAMYRTGMLAAAHDATRIGEWYVPTLEIEYTEARLDTEAAASLDRWADSYPEASLHGRTLHSIERVELASGEGLRLELTGQPPEGAATVAEIRYLVAAPAGVFDLLFSVTAEDLPAYEATFDEIASSFLALDPDPEGTLARLARGELLRTEYEMLAGGYTVVPEAAAPELPAGSLGPVVAGGRIEVPARGLALRIPEDWHAFDLTHPDVTTAMERFDATSRAFREGRLLPENPLQRGRFAVTSEGLHSFAMAAAQSVAANESSDAFDLVAIAPWDGIGAPHECVVYSWDTAGTSLAEEALITEMSLRENGYEVTQETTMLPAGEARHIAGTDGRWEVSLRVLEHRDRFVYLECGHRERHEEAWQEIAASLEIEAEDS